MRGYKHRSAFDKAAKELKVRPEAYEDLYHLSGYKPDSDKPDYDKIKSLVSETVKSRSWLIESEAAASKHDEADASKGAPAGAGANGKQTGPAGAGADRGQSPRLATQAPPGKPRYAVGAEQPWPWPLPAAFNAELWSRRLVVRLNRCILAAKPLVNRGLEQDFRSGVLRVKVRTPGNIHMRLPTGQQNRVAGTWAARAGAFPPLQRRLLCV